MCSIAFAVLVALVSSSLADGKNNLVHHIVFGEDAIDPTPYQVSLQLYVNPIRKWYHICGGSIISSNYVLTAAHCSVDKINKLRILAGTNNLKTSGYHHRVVVFKTHPKFSVFNGSDIAVVKVSPSFRFSRRIVGKIGFEGTDAVPGNTEAIFTGWGLTEYGFPKILQKGDFLTLTNAKCQSDAYPDLTSTDICAIGGGFNLVYLGDSGGPLVNTQQTMQIGVLSYGVRNVRLGFPGVFTRVSAFVDWIKEEIAK